MKYNLISKRTSNYSAEIALVTVLLIMLSAVAFAVGMDRRENSPQRVAERRSMNEQFANRFLGRLYPQVSFTVVCDTGFGTTHCTAAHDQEPPIPLVCVRGECRVQMSQENP